jgi:hypothetical protein
MTQNAESYHDPEFIEAVHEVFGTRSDALSPEALSQLYLLWDAGRKSVVSKNVEKVSKSAEDLLLTAKARMAEMKCAFCNGRGVKPKNLTEREVCPDCNGTGHMGNVIP